MRHYNEHAAAGRKSQPPGYRFETGGYEQFQVIYVCKGRLIFETRGEEAVLPPGGVALLKKGSAFRLCCRGVGYRGLWFASYGEDIPEFSGEAAAFPATPEMRSIAALMGSETHSPSAGSEQVIKALGRTLAWLAVRSAERNIRRGEREERARRWAAAAKNALDAALHSGMNPRETLSSLALSYRQLSRYFVEIYGVSPKEYQQKARIEESKRLLAATSLSITDIALELGYCSSQHFADRCKRLTGFSPREYRAATRK